MSVIRIALEKTKTTAKLNFIFVVVVVVLIPCRLSMILQTNKIFHKWVMMVNKESGVNNESQTNLPQTKIKQKTTMMTSFY